MSQALLQGLWRPFGGPTVPLCRARRKLLQSLGEGLRPRSIEPWPGADYTHLFDVGLNKTCLHSFGLLCKAITSLIETL